MKIIVRRGNEKNVYPKCINRANYVHAKNCFTATITIATEMIEFYFVFTFLAGLDACCSRYVDKSFSNYGSVHAFGVILFDRCI